MEQGFTRRTPQNKKSLTKCLFSWKQSHKFLDFFFGTIVFLELIFIVGIGKRDSAFREFGSLRWMAEGRIATNRWDVIRLIWARCWRRMRRRVLVVTAHFESRSLNFFVVVVVTERRSYSRWRKRQVDISRCADSVAVDAVFDVAVTGRRNRFAVGRGNDVPEGWAAAATHPKRGRIRRRSRSRRQGLNKEKELRKFYLNVY